MIDQTPKRKAGRPRLPDAPQNSAECLRLISIETAKTAPSVYRLRPLYRLLKAFERSEEAARNDKRNRLLAEQVRLSAEELAHPKADYRLRFASKPLGVRNLLTKAERLKERIRTIEV